MGEIVRLITKDKEKNMEIIAAMKNNPEDAGLIGYLAGIMDGEGTIGIKKFKAKMAINHTYYVYLALGMTTKEIIVLFTELFGGSKKVEKQVRPNRKTMYRWNATGRVHVKAILELLMPHLRAKRRQAELAMECLTTWKFQERNGKQPLPTSKEELEVREAAHVKMRSFNAGTSYKKKRQDTQKVL